MALTEDDDPSVEALNDTVKRIITESAVEVSGKIGRQDIGKLSQEAKDLVKKR